jgi:hypothetical protein
MVFSLRIKGPYRKLGVYEYQSDLKACGRKANT